MKTEWENIANGDDDETKHNKKQRGEKPKKKKKWASCTRDTRFAMRSTYIFI